MSIIVAECAEHKGVYKEHKAGGGGGVPIEVSECILMEGQV